MASISPDLAIRWENAEPGHAALLRQLAPDMVVSAAASPSLTAAGLRVVNETELGPLVSEGLWPGIRRAGSRAAREAEVASPSAEPWVDSNGYLVSYYRALQPGPMVTLAYQPNEKFGVREDVEVPFGTLELALIEARFAGGNFILDLPARYRSRLLAGDAPAVDAWKSLCRTCAWLKANAALFGRPALPIITALVEPGAATREIANLLHRRGASPLLWNAASPMPAGIQPAAVVAAGLKHIPESAVALAQAGSILVLDQPPPQQATLIKQEPDRKFYSLGKGSVVAYNRRILDPSEFALDVIDLITHKRRAARLWNASSAIPMATSGERPGEAILRVVHYGSSPQEEVQAHIQGHYSKAVLLSPQGPPQPLKTARRGTSTEIFLPVLSRLAVVRFSN